jgi:hypothetical protein
MCKQHIWSSLLVLVTLLSFTACEDYLDINENPNTATEAPLDGLLANTSYQTSLNVFRVGSFTSFFVQYLASPNAGANNDTYVEADYSGTWGNLYGALTDLYDLQQFAVEKSAYQHIGVAKVMTAINLGLLVDCWNDIPFSDAFTGETVTPKYDSGSGVYDDIFRLLTEAENDFANPDNAVALDADSDFIHGGDLAAWRKTIAALRARYLLHTGAAASDILMAVDSAYTSSAEDAVLATFQNRSPWGQVALDNENLFLGGWLSEQYADALNGTTFGVVDPRLALLVTPTDEGTYVGTANGVGRTGDGTAAIESYLSTSGALSSEGSPVQIITYPEVKFIEAEAALASDPARALAAFQEGIRASIVHIHELAGAEGGVAAADDYLNAAYPGLTADNLDMDLIFKEKYAALFLHPETWVDARRHDYNYQDFTLPEGANLSEFIRRVQYPDSELTRNRGNVPSVTLTDRIFWDN